MVGVLQLMAMVVAVYVLIVMREGHANKEGTMVLMWGSSAERSPKGPQLQGLGE